MSRYIQLFADKYLRKDEEFTKSGLMFIIGACSVLSPTYMVECSEASELMFEKLLAKLVEYKKILPSLADQAKYKFSHFMSCQGKQG